MAEKISLIATIPGKIDSKTLYESVKQYNMNVLDMGDKTLVYNFNSVSPRDIVDTMYVCFRYGKCEVRISYSAAH